MTFPVFDLHCDTALKLAGTHDHAPEALYKNQGHIDLDRASSLPGYCQCFGCFTTPFMEEWEHQPPMVIFEREMEMVMQELGRNSDIIHQAFCPEDIRENQKNGLMSAILTIEGPAGFDYNPELLQDLYQMGFRITSLGWNEKNPLTGSHETGGGLTDLGKVFVREAQRLGMLIDVSHISDEGFWDIMDITQAPVCATHSNSRAVHSVSRNLTDDMFAEICKTGGCAGFNLCADFISDHPDLEACYRHILHFLEIDSDGKHIALGGDLDGCEVLPIGFDGVQDYPKLAQALLEHGLSEEYVHNIFWENSIGVMEACCI